MRATTTPTRAVSILARATQNVAKRGKTWCVCVFRTPLRFVNNVRRGIKPIAPHRQRLLAPVLRGEGCRCFASYYYDQGTSAFHAMGEAMQKQTKTKKKRTLKTALDLHNLLATWVFHRKRLMEMEMLFYDAEEMNARHIRHLFAPGHGQELALHLEDRGALGELDCAYPSVNFPRMSGREKRGANPGRTAERVTGEREHLFFQDNGFGRCCKELREHANRPRDGRKDSSHDGWVVAYIFAMERGWRRRVNTELGRLAILGSLYIAGVWLFPRKPRKH